MPNLNIIDQKGNQKTILVETGSNLREVLLDHQVSPYTSLTQKLNCGGNGICATCGVIIKESTEARHWHDWLAKKFRYPRLSCQIDVERDMEIVIPKKLIWGGRIKKGRHI
jgi:ferredoxin